MFGILQYRIFNLFSLDNGAKMSPKRRTFLSLVFACICISKSLLINTMNGVIIIYDIESNYFPFVCLEKIFSPKEGSLED